MHSRQKFRSHLAIRTDDAHLMLVAGRGQGFITRPTIGLNATARLDEVADKPKQARLADIWNFPHTNASDAFAIRLRSHDDQRFLADLATVGLFVKCADIGLIDFDIASEFVASGTNHGAADFVEPGPGGLVGNAQNPL